VGLISQHQLSTFSSPVNGTSPIDANTVRGNDNTVKTAYNAHDADTTIHLQNGLVASRPAASTAGQMWLASDAGAVYAYLDTGSAWVEVNYLRSTGGTVSGPVTVSDTTDSSSSTTGALIVSGGVGIAKKLYVGTTLTAGTGLTVTAGTSALQAVTATTATVSGPILSLADGSLVRGVNAAATTQQWGIGTTLAVKGSGSALDMAVYSNLGITFFANASVTTPIGTMTSGGVFAWGTTVQTGASAGDVVLANTHGVRGVSAAGTTTFALVSIDGNSIPQIGDSAAGAFPAIPRMAPVAANAAYKGGILVDSGVAGQFVFYDGVTGARYKLTGTAF
jgi:hypothetical protein